MQKDEKAAGLGQLSLKLSKPDKATSHEYSSTLVCKKLQKSWANASTTYLLISCFMCN